MKSTTRQLPFSTKAALLLPALFLALPDAAWAYLGPGAGLGMVGSLIAVVVGILVAIAGVVLYPFRLYRKWRNKRKAGRDPA